MSVKSPIAEKPRLLFIVMQKKDGEHSAIIIVMFWLCLKPNSGKWLTFWECLTCDKGSLFHGLNNTLDTKTFEPYF